ncbi:TPA: hypothetical protein ACJGUQ_003647 [Salmonella enterica subsp. enterica serovar Ball]
MILNRYILIILLGVICAGISLFANAYTCTMQGKTVGSISSLNSKNIDVHIDPQMYISPDQSGRVLIDLFRDMKCRNDFTGFIDKIYINSTITDVPVVLTDTAGVYVNGSKIANETLAITLPYENGIWRPVPVQVMAKWGSLIFCMLEVSY